VDDFRRFIIGFLEVAQAIVVIAATVVVALIGAGFGSLFGMGFIGFLIGAFVGFFLSASAAAFFFLLSDIAENTRKTQAGRAAFDEAKWNALVEFDPDIAAAVERLRPLGGKYVDELAEKFLALNDKQYLDTIVRRIVEQYEVLSESEHLADLGEADLGKNVDYIFATPFGYLMGMKDGTVIALRGAEVERLPSIKSFYEKYREDATSWRELTDPNEKREFYKTAASVLR
jgi:hypothetical protein